MSMTIASAFLWYGEQQFEKFLLLSQSQYHLDCLGGLVPGSILLNQAEQFRQLGLDGKLFHQLEISFLSPLGASVPFHRRLPFFILRNVEALKSDQGFDNQPVLRSDFFSEKKPREKKK